MGFSILWYKYVYMMTLFNEEVKTTSTNSVHNTLYVEKFEEVFFGVYEFELNGSAVIAEEVAKYEGEPVVTIPVVDDGTRYEAPFILKRGLQKAEFNTANTVFVEKVIEEPDLNTVVEAVKQNAGENNNVNITYNVDKDDIIRELKESLEADKSSIIESLRKENNNTLEQIENIRDSIFIEFTTSSDNYRDKESKELKAYIKKTLNDICHENNILVESSLQGDAKFASERDINRALSRVGSVKKELADSKEAVAKTITLAEERIKKHYDAKIREVEEAAVNNIRRNEILEVVKDSKAKILAELNNSHGLKKQLRHIAEEASKGQYDPVSSKRFQDQLKRDLAQKFSGEMQQIKRMIELGAGGGTNAVQYARGGTMNGNLNVNGTILSGGVDISSLFTTSTGGGGGSGDGTIDGSGTAGNITLWDGVSTITDSVMTEDGGNISINGGIDTVFSIALSSAVSTTTLSAGSAGLYTSSGIDVNGDTTINGNLSVLGDFTYIDTVVSVTSSLSVINHGTGPAFYAEQTGASQPIAKFVDTEGGIIVFNDGGNVGIGTDAPGHELTVSGDISASGTVYSSNIETLTNNVSALYSYLVQNFDSNTITTATSINDFVTSFPKTGLVTGDVITVSATNTAYILGDNDGSSLSDWLEVNLKPNFLFYKQGLAEYSVLDTLALSSVNSTKYVIEVSDKSDGAIFYGEINVVSDGAIAVATEYALNHTTIFPFVEFGAEVISGTHIQLSAVALEGKDMTDFVFKGNRSNLFG